MNKQEIEKAIEELKVRSNYVADINIKTKKAYEVAISALEQQLTDDWIPVSERLPKECNKEYLVTFYNGIVSALIFDKEKDWVDVQWCRYTDDVVAWQSLPEPYKEVKDAERNFISR